MKQKYIFKRSIRRATTTNFEIFTIRKIMSISENSKLFV